MVQPQLGTAAMLRSARPDIAGIAGIADHPLLGPLIEGKIRSYRALPYYIARARENSRPETPQPPQHTPLQPINCH